MAVLSVFSQKKGLGPLGVNHSIPNNEEKLWGVLFCKPLRFRKHMKLSFALNFENFQMKIKLKDMNCLLENSH